MKLRNKLITMLILLIVISLSVYSYKLFFNGKYYHTKAIKCFNEGKYIEAERLYYKSASLGYIKSLNELGEIYYTGKAVAQNLEKAKDLFEKASAKGSSKAKYNIGTMYLEGKGVKKDFIKAKELFKQAAPGCIEAKIQLKIIEKQEEISKYNSQNEKKYIEINLLEQEALDGLKQNNYHVARDAYEKLLLLYEKNDSRYQDALKKKIVLNELIKRKAEEDGASLRK